jgi:5'-3' exonuclease
MQQQRKRRFISSWRSRTLNELIVKNCQSQESTIEWDSNTVTPGTEFMTLLEEQLLHAKDKLGSKPGVKVILSTSQEFGEGEHKIFKIMQHIDSSDTIIYGLDADLILLSLLENTSIKLLRESPEFGSREKNSKQSFMFLDINLLKKAIITDISKSNKQRDLQNLLDDYVMLCTLLGNDFLPPLSYIKLKDNGLEILLNAYNNATQFDNAHLVYKRQELNMTVLASIILYLSKSEDNTMLECSIKYYETEFKSSTRHEYHEHLTHYIDSYPIIHKPEFEINIQDNKAWRLDWYHYLFGSHMPEMINEACTIYTQGLHWVFAYYFTKNCNFSWYYPYNYSPCLLDLSHYISNSLTVSCHSDKHLNTHNSHKIFVEIINPDIQLLMVLPPQSANLMKPHLRSLVYNLSHGVSHYYPISFKIVTYLKQYLWECSPCLPDINFEQLVQSYMRVINQNE